MENNKVILSRENLKYFFALVTLAFRNFRVKDCLVWRNIFKTNLFISLGKKCLFTFLNYFMRGGS